MTTDQPRTPGGRPDGGEFASRQWPDADVTLTHDDFDVDAYNRTGTFLFPPRPQSAEQLIRFWETVAIDDAVLETISLGYERWADGWQRAQTDKWLTEEYMPANRIDRHKYRAGALPVGVTAQIDAAAAEYRKTLTVTHPDRIEAMDAREVARAGQLWYYSGVLSEEDQERIDEHSIIVEGRPRSVADVVDRYNLRNLRDWFAGPTRAIVESLEQSREDLAAIAEMTS